MERRAPQGDEGISRIRRRGFSAQIGPQIRSGWISAVVAAISLCRCSVLCRFHVAEPHIPFSNYDPEFLTLNYKYSRQAIWYVDPRHPLIIPGICAVTYPLLGRPHGFILYHLQNPACS
jgi:hypothetical protein